FKKGCFTRSGLAGKKNVFGRVVYQVSGQMEQDIGRVFFVHDNMALKLQKARRPRETEGFK
ncbi:MAG: hypothetical protein ACXVBT_07105, partial [Flavisolibacter sp.]